MAKFDIGDKVLCLHKIYKENSRLVFDKNGMRWKGETDTTFYKRKAIISKVDKQKDCMV